MLHKIMEYKKNIDIDTITPKVKWEL